MRIGFDGGRLNERGVAVALFDYAWHARRLLGVEPFILHDVGSPPEPAHWQRFANAFPTLGYRNETEMAAHIEAERLDVAYFLKTRRKDKRVSRTCRTAVHEVFGFFQPHGDSYAYVSSSLSRQMSGGRVPFVPHIVDLRPPTGNLREELGIPDTAVVVGRHGALDQFNIPFLPRAIEAALAARRDLWFVFLNTQRFMTHERVVHIPGTSDRGRVSNFVATCDAGLNGRRVGETFGLSIAEFLARDKPVWVWAGGRDRNHLELVSHPDWIYRDREDLARKLIAFQPRPGDGAWRERVASFTPERVMESFSRVFLEAGGGRAPKLPLGYRAGTRIASRLRAWRESAWLES